VLILYDIVQARSSHLMFQNVLFVPILSFEKRLALADQLRDQAGPANRRKTS